MGLRGPHAYGLTRRPWYVKPSGTRQLCCWNCRKMFTAKRVDRMYCSAACKTQAHRRRKMLADK